MKTAARFFRTAFVVVSLGVLISVFQNCAPDGQFQTFDDDGSLDLASAPPPTPIFCTSSTGGQLSPGQTLQGYPMSAALYPQLCGAQVTRTCLQSGLFDGSVALNASCTQQCLHPDNNQAMSAGGQYTYFTRSTGATQAECDAARVVSSCQQATGLFAPAVAATRFTACMVQGQTCAYSVVAGTSTPTGNSVGSTVIGFATQSATYPNLCGHQVTRTCQNSGAWTGAVPVYTACTQKCVHPETLQPVDANTQYTYYTRANGTEAECLAARQVSNCQMSSGVFSPSVESSRFTSCQIQNNEYSIRSFC